MAFRIWSKSSALASSWCPCGYSSPKLLYSFRRSSRVSSVPMEFRVMLRALLSACAQGEASAHALQLQQAVY